ncbi:MAG: DUF1552 domain-containing protein [Verrucomicrobiales bacterium]|nr:DUF1552 domain-containing protein [Verrucomicrobiales bacterium]
MHTDRRTFIKGIGGTLALPFLESNLIAGATTPTRFLVVANPFGMHPEHFFPKDFGKDFTMSRTLKSLEWLKDRISILSHTDHNMVSGHGREIAFLSGVLPADAQAFPEKNMSVDQAVARHTGAHVRYPSLNVGLGSGVRMSWTANGVENALISDPQRLYDHLFLNLTRKQKKARRDMLTRNESILDAVGDQLSAVARQGSKADAGRLDQYQTAIRELENTLAGRQHWIGQDKPSFDISHHYEGAATIHNEYHAFFDMISFAFETDMTRVATIAFPTNLSYTDVSGVTRSYHGTTHNGKMEDVTDELVAIESFQIEQLSRCLKRLDSIPEPNAEGSLLDHTVVLFGSGMGYGGTHSNRNLPVFVAGGGFDHLGHVDTRNESGENMALCNLFVTLMQRFGIERDEFNLSTGAFDLRYG